MKSKQLAQIARTIAHELPWLTPKGKLLLALPLENILKAVCLDTSGFDPEGFYVQVFAQPLFVPLQNIAFNFGWRLRGSETHLWDGYDPQVAQNLARALTDEPAKFFSRIQAPIDLAIEAQGSPFAGDLIVNQFVAYSLARAGDISRAVPALRDVADRVGTDHPWRVALANQARELAATLQHDPAAAVRQFEHWEKDTAVALNVDEFRHRTS